MVAIQAAACLLLAAAAVAAAAAGAAPAQDAEAGPALPITKAVRLLKEMQKDLEKEAKEEEATYKDLTCWCTSNEQKKTEAVESAKSRIEALEAAIEASSGEKGSLGASIEQLKQDIAASKQALAEATQLRKEEAAAFHTQETELISSIELLRGAITTLAKHHPTMLQEDQENSQVQALRPVLRRLVHRHLSLLGWLRGSGKEETFLTFLDARPDLLEPDVPSRTGSGFLLQRSASSRWAVQPFFRSYAPQSGQVLGVLRQMKESFEADMPEIQKEEMAKQETFAALRGSKQAEIANLQASLESKITALADSQEALATAKGDLEDTRASMSADQRFLIDLTERCTRGDHEWERRSKLRLEEIQAVSEAIGILSTDLVKDGQQTTFGFLQTALSRRGGENRRARATAILQRFSAQAPDLALLAESASVATVEKVIKAIDDLVAKLKVEQADEVKQRDFCVGELHENEVQAARKEAERQSLEAQVSDLTARGGALSDEVSSLRQEISDLQVALQRAAENRKHANLEFRRTIADHRRTVVALKQAHSRLAGFYMKHETLLQQEPAGDAATTPAPAPEFKDYATHSASTHVLTLLQRLVGEAQVLEDAALHGEQEAQAAYEELVAETNASVEAKARLIADKTEELASVEQARHRAESERDGASASLEALAGTKVALQQQCTFLLTNFAARQEARAAELDGLAEAKAILGGMSS
mmetsp:Transcript_100664/g.204081  ORF Transcript_100664/g.204081 Transcript_100664/m.204081 type:complete len:709 (-) Transcript_100664:117-2243(-)